MNLAQGQGIILTNLIPGQGIIFTNLVPGQSSVSDVPMAPYRMLMNEVTPTPSHACFCLTMDKLLATFLEDFIV